MDAREYKDFTGIEKRDNLREPMTDLELALTGLSELCRQRRCHAQAPRAAWRTKKLLTWL